MKKWPCSHRLPPAKLHCSDGTRLHFSKHKTSCPFFITWSIKLVIQDSCPVPETSPQGKLKSPLLISQLLPWKLTCEQLIELRTQQLSTCTPDLFHLLRKEGRCWRNVSIVLIVWGGNKPAVLTPSFSLVTHLSLGLDGLCLLVPPVHLPPQTCSSLYQKNLSAGHLKLPFHLLLQLIGDSPRTIKLEFKLLHYQAWHDLICSSIQLCPLPHSFIFKNNSICSSVKVLCCIPPFNY